ncbi:MAG TPA: metallophosphoesterase [Tissierellaceae bacterium]|jgi:UDP-2,3-diacylglucosamine pyrophosphatase LpxH|nr:metallophosphoesterase [Tissierellaceae bacterium]
MFTQKRLDQAYEGARLEYFDDSSKYVFMSDHHRGDGGTSDEFTKNQNVFLFALDHYYKNGFTYVEVGDGDELWEQPKFKYIKNAHYDVFENIKKFFYHDRLIMLYGNHNIYLKDHDYVKKYYYSYYNDFREQRFDFLKGLVPIESLVLKHRKTGQEILVVHGHQGDLANDQLWFPTMLSLKYFWRFMHSFGIRNPASPTKNVYKRHKIEKNFNKWILKNRKMVICGHTHRFKFPRTDDLPYFNTGCCIYPTTITAIEMEGGRIQIVRWKMRVNQDGLLQAKREVIRGSELIGKYDIRE